MRIKILYADQKDTGEIGSTLAKNQVLLDI